jgi:hypothetical protein
MDSAQVDHRFERRQEALAREMFVLCVPLVNAWIARHRTAHPIELPVTVHDLEILTVGTAQAPQWIAWVTRTSLGELGAGISYLSPVHAAIRFRCWLDVELELEPVTGAR